MILDQMMIEGIRGCDGCCPPWDVLREVLADTLRTNLLRTDDFLTNLLTELLTEILTGCRVFVGFFVGNQSAECGNGRLGGLLANQPRS